MTLCEIFVRWQQEGWHNWPEAPEHRYYLRASHRHIFYYEVRVGVRRDEYDRGIEFHDLLDYCKGQTKGTQLGANSCEMLAEAMGHSVQQWLLGQDLGLRIVQVTVSEDNECGATVTRG